MPIELIQISAKTLAELPKAQTVFFYPVAALEDHGPHLPLGLKLAHAKKLCLLAAERLERELSGWHGVIMPEAPLGVDTITSQTVLRVRAHVLRDWLIDSCRELKRMGFIHFVCFSGHLTPKQLTAIEEAGKMLNPLGAWSEIWIPKKRRANRATLVSACSPLVAPKEIFRSPLIANPKEHGGAIDTSIALDLLAAHVDPSFAALPPVSKTSPGWRRLLSYKTARISGYWGAPADAKAEEGLKHLNGQIDDIFPKLRAVWEQANPNFLFRSWYSLIPMNKGLFKIYLLALVLLVILWVWALYALRGLLA